ncbi:MAG: cation diffusion facilitator family transporter, partial [Candidatus Eremiobacteraeota bacterium]|nr:cation diffusion facilitator family transporter [Candidatus Eremiobacteraeota bacterium]
MSRNHSHGGTDVGKMRLALIVMLGILLLEAGGGFISHSLALLTDAAHMLTDVGSAALGLWAARMALRKNDKQHTFGYGRATILAALANVTALFAIVLFLIYEAVVRLGHPESVQAGIMTIVATVALLSNLLLTWFLTRGDSGSLNVKAVVAHVTGDAAISGAVIVAAVLIYFTGVLTIDPIISLLAAVAVSFSAWGIVRDSLSILMEGTPRGLDIGQLESYLMENAGIDAVHDVHVWCVSDRKTATSLHVKVPQIQLSRGPETVSRVKQLLHDKFDIEHCTV